MSGLDSADTMNADLLGYTSEIVASYIKQNQIPQGDLPGLIRSVFAALGGISLPAAVAAPEELKPAVSVRKSITDDYLICLEDGMKLKMLKRYLRTHYDLTPEQYRTKWGLPGDYPMVAPNYAALRSDMAKRIGLGRTAPASGRGRKKAT